jgi:hypothetical protein
MKWQLAMDVKAKESKVWATCLLCRLIGGHVKCHRSSTIGISYFVFCSSSSWDSLMVGLGKGLGLLYD